MEPLETSLPSLSVSFYQVSEEDEIAKIKRQNKSGASSSETPAAVPEAREPPSPARPAADRVAALKKADEDRRRGSSHEVSSVMAPAKTEIFWWDLKICTPFYSPSTKKDFFKNLLTTFSSNLVSFFSLNLLEREKILQKLTKKQLGCL